MINFKGGILMPVEIWYLIAMFAVVTVGFTLLKRPLYECMLAGFIVLVAITGTWADIGTFIWEALKEPTLYVIFAFILSAELLSKTSVIDDCIAIILSIFGRLRGGAGFVAVIGSSYMGSLSGSGPGNVATTGVFTIPAMIRSGFPPHLAANVEAHSSTMGNMIPPAGMIGVAFALLDKLYPNTYTMPQYWLLLWGIALWFVAQRMLMVWGFCKYYKVKPLSKEELPSLKETFKKGWRGLLLPVIILLPFVLDYLFKDSFFTARLGKDGAKYFSSSILLFIGGVASIYTCLIAPDKKVISVKNLINMFAGSVKSMSPSIGVCIFGYMIGAMFNDLSISDELGMIITSWNFGKFGTVIAVCVITCFMGMVIPGSSIVVIFGPMFITSLATVGCDPLLVAAMLPCICGVMCGITPPLGLGMYAGMTLAESDFNKTFNNNLWWVAAQFVLEVVVLMGWLPILGL